MSHIDSCNKEERNAIRSLQKLADSWPQTLWLFAASGTLLCMKKTDGERVTKGWAYDQEFAVEVIGIECDGGDF